MSQSIEAKKQEVAQVSEKFKAAKAVIAFKYQGLSVLSSKN